MSEWISVEDMLPPFDERVLISTPEGVYSGWRTEATDDGVDEMGGDAGFMSMDWTIHPARSIGSPEYMYEAQNQPSHWMPLPKPPRG